MSELTIATTTGFDLMGRVAKAMAASDMVPDTYKCKPSNVLIALDLSGRLNMAPLMVMQNLYIIKGRPAWSSQFVIACINQSGRFTPVRFEFSGTGDDKSCVAWAHSKDDGARIEGPSVSIKMAKDEGWWNKPDKNGKNTSKWPTMPDLMLTYRAAAFFGRTYCPEMFMGIYEEHEVCDIKEVDYVEVKEPKPAPESNLDSGEKKEPKTTSHHNNDDKITPKEVQIIEEIVDPSQVKKPKMSEKQISQLAGKIKDNAKRLHEDPEFSYVEENHALFEKTRAYFDITDDELVEIFGTAEAEFQKEMGLA